LLAVAFLAATIGCNSTPKITGAVKDEFGKPVRGATVTVEGTTFTALTDSQGNYSIQYIPGAVTVEVHREGYTSASYSMSIATPMQYPAAPVTMVWIPRGEGILLFGPSEYVRVNVNFYSRNQTERIEPVGVLSFRAIDEHFKVFTDPSIPKFASGHLKFLDTTTTDMKLIQLSPGGDILVRKYYLDGFKDEMQVMPEQVKNYREARVRESDLAPGQYAFVAFRDVGDWMRHKPEPMDAIYSFAVVQP